MFSNFYNPFGAGFILENMVPKGDEILFKMSDPGGVTEIRIVSNISSTPEGVAGRWIFN